MKHLSRALIAVLLAVLMAALLPVQVLADTPYYISEVKIYEGSCQRAADEGYTVLSGDNGKPVDLNSGSGSTDIGAKSIMVYYKVDPAAAASTTGSSFSAGTLALAGGGGLLIGVLGTLLATSKKRRENKAVTE